jgi:hypothetical protein
MGQLQQDYLTQLILCMYMGTIAPHECVE